MKTSNFGWTGGGGSTPPPANTDWLLNGNSEGAEKYFGTNDNFDIPLYTNGVVRGVFDKTGNFGFGKTSSLTARVHIEGVDSTSTNFAIKIDNSTAQLLYIRNNGIYDFLSHYDAETNGGQSYKYSVSSGGNVTGYYASTGFNNRLNFYTNNVLYSQLQDGTGFTALSTTTRFSLKTLSDNKSHLWMDGSTGFIGIGDNYIASAASLHITGISSTSSNYALKVDNSASTPILYARNNGFVGFGTSTPSYPIDLMGWYGVNSEQISLFAGYNIGMSGTTIYFRNPQPSGQPFRWQTASVDGIAMSSSAGGNMGLHIGDAAISAQSAILTVGWSSSTASGNLLNLLDTSSVTVFRVRQTGDVSIGNVTATAKLHIIGVDSTSSNFAFKADSSASSPLLYIRNDGGVSVGIATTSARMHVFGVNGSINLRLEPVTNVTEDTTGNTVNTTDATSNVTAQTIAIPSDKVVSLETTIVYRKTGGAGVGTTGDGTTIKLNSSVKNVGGTLTLDTIQNTYTGTVNAIAGVSATYTISSSNILVSVTGVVNDNITWNVITKLNTVG